MATSDTLDTPVDLSTLRNILDDIDESIPVQNDTEDDPYTVVELNVLLWNIHGDSSGGMADARRLLVGEVVKECSPDVLLLQEVEAHKTIEHIATKCQPRNYVSYRSTKPTEAYIMYDKHCFEFVSSIDLPKIIGDGELISAAAVATRSGGNASSSFYDSRSCAIRLRRCGTTKEFVSMSFHNASTRTGGRKANVISLAKGFLKLVCMVHYNEGVPVIAGGDFNCDRSDLLARARELDCKLPDYNKSERRKSCAKIDLYILKSSTFINSTVEVFEALPLADPTSSEADFHPLGRGPIRYLVENAPITKGGRKLTRDDYTKTTNHDSTLSKVTVNFFNLVLF